MTSFGWEAREIPVRSGDVSLAVAVPFMDKVYYILNVHLATNINLIGRIIFYDLQPSPNYWKGMTLHDCNLLTMDVHFKEDRGMSSQPMTERGIEVGDYLLFQGVLL